MSGNRRPTARGPAAREMFDILEGDALAKIA